jgi:Antidote-toxin recognition MazE, bacterial antitoxin
MVTINPRTKFFNVVQGIDKGKTCAVTLPKKFVRDLRISVGDYVLVTCAEGKIMIETLNSKCAS